MPATRGQQNAQSSDFNSQITKYIPALVLNKIIKSHEQNKGSNQKQTLPELQPMETCVMFADISGFTNVSEACAKKGVRGNEELAFCINRYMEGMVKNLSKYGGDIIKFAGDAMIVMWPPVEPSQTHSQRELAQLTIRKAIQCALDIQKEMNNKQIIAGVASLSVKIGIGYGKCALLYVGGVFDRTEIFTIGDALFQALHSEGCATGGGQVICHKHAYEYVRDFYKTAKEVKSDDEDLPFYLVAELTGEGVKSRADALQLRPAITPETFAQIRPQLRACVPAAIIPYLQVGAEEFGSETRSLTVMFAMLGVELSSADTKEGMNKIQKIVTTVQKQVYRQQGSVNKLLMDDKGSTLICLWGLSPMAHEDDASRAILTAYNIKRELAKIDNIWVNVGISSGEVFSGVAGTSGSRKEFTVLGDVVNLAARIMYFPKMQGKKGMIHCDLNTKFLASNYFDFTYSGHQEFKGKSLSISIYEPIAPEVEFAEINKKILSYGNFLKIHANPLILDRNYDSKKVKGERMIGCSAQLNDITSDLVEFFTGNHAPEKPYLLAVRGDTGSGKTMFARALCIELSKCDEFVQFQSSGHKLPLLTSSLNSETELEFLNIWRPILKMMMTFYCQKEGLRKDQALRQLLNCGFGAQANDDKVDILCELLGVDKSLLVKKGSKIGSSPQVQPADKGFIQFVCRMDYPENTRDDIIELCRMFINMVLGELDEVSQFDDYSQSTSKQKKAAQSSSDDVQERPPVILFLDTAQLMDTSSWLLLESVINQCTRIAVIMCFKTDDQDNLLISPESKSVFQRVWNSEDMEHIRQVDLPKMKKDVLKQLLKQAAPSYQSSYAEEVTAMTAFFPERENIYKSLQGCKQWKEHFHKKWSLKHKFTNVHENILDGVASRCGGNPLLCMNFFLNLLQNNYITVDSSGMCKPEKKYERCTRLNDWTEVPVPRIANKINCAMIDTFLNTVMRKAKKMPMELENTVKSIIFMKAACVLGDDFELSALEAVQPLRRGETIKSIKSAMKKLECADFIEFLDETDGKNDICRFNKSFLRESIYQIILYKNQRKVLHGIFADHLLSQLPSADVSPEIAHEKLKIHMQISQDMENEDDLSLQNRTGLMVRRMQNLISKDPNTVIKKGFIFKQGRGANKNTQSRLVTLSTQHFRWYHNEEEVRQKAYLGSIPVAFIFQVVASKIGSDKTAFDFNLACAQHYNKKQELVDKSEQFFFGTDSMIERDEWVIALDFLRTKAVYDQYASKNLPVQFPLRTKEETKDQDGDHLDVSQLLQNFGGQIKSNTTMKGYNANAGSTQDLNTSGSRTSALPRKSMLIRQQFSVVPEEQGITADQLLPKLRMLYNAGICSFMHHLNQTSAKMTVRQQTAHLGQFPDNSYEVMADRAEQILKDTEMKTPPKPGKSNSSYIDAKSSSSDLSSQGPTKKVNLRSSGRRSSSISADNVIKAQQAKQAQVTTDGIKEVAEDSNSSEEDKRKPFAGVQMGRRGTQRHSQNIHVAANLIESKDHQTQSANAPGHSILKNSDNSDLPSPPLSQMIPNEKGGKKLTPSKSSEHEVLNLTKELDSANQVQFHRFEDNRQTFAAQQRPSQYQHHQGKSSSSIQSPETMVIREGEQENFVLEINNQNKQRSEVEAPERPRTSVMTEAQHPGLSQLIRDQQAVAPNSQQLGTGSGITVEALSQAFNQSIGQSIQQLVVQNQQMFAQQQAEFSNIMAQQQDAFNKSIHQQSILSMSNAQLSRQASNPYLNHGSAQPSPAVMRTEGFENTQRSSLSGFNNAFHTPLREQTGRLSQISSHSGMTSSRRQVMETNTAPMSKGSEIQEEDEVLDPEDGEDNSPAIHGSYSPYDVNQQVHSDNELTQAETKQFFQQQKKKMAGHGTDEEGHSQKTMKPNFFYDPKQQMQPQFGGNIGLKNVQIKLERPVSSKLVTQRQETANAYPQMNQNFRQQYPVAESTADKYQKGPAKPTLNFQDERMYFPAPDKWIEHEYAEFEEIQQNPRGNHSRGLSNVSSNPTTISLAFTVRDTTCQLHGKRFTIAEGTQVQIIESIPKVQMYRVQHKGQTGIFPWRDFKKVSHPNNQSRDSHVRTGSNVSGALGGVQNKTIDQMSPIHHLDEVNASRQNFFKEFPEKDLSRELSKLNTSQLADVSKKFLEEDKINLKAANLKLVERQKRKAKESRRVKTSTQFGNQ